MQILVRAIVFHKHRCLRKKSCSATVFQIKIFSFTVFSSGASNLFGVGKDIYSKFSSNFS